MKHGPLGGILCRFESERIVNRAKIDGWAPYATNSMSETHGGLSSIYRQSTSITLHVKHMECRASLSITVHA